MDEKAPLDIELYPFFDSLIEGNIGPEFERARIMITW